MAISFGGYGSCILGVWLCYLRSMIVLFVGRGNFIWGYGHCIGGYGSFIGGGGVW